MPRILYLVPNLSDPAVSRRVAMFRLGGAEVDIAGFRRADAPPADLPLTNVVELDITHDARMLQRLVATLRAGGRAKGWAKGLSRPDVIVARNLEMLVVANRLLSTWSDAPGLVYECLDIHRLMLRRDGIGSAMRAVERRLIRQTDWLVTSSPAFVTNHFASQSPPPVILIENRVFAPGLLETGRNPVLTGDAHPIRIGWFGALRCNRSLAALQALAQAFSGGIEVMLRGRPALTEFDDFQGTVSVARHLDYGGAYAYPADLAGIYSAIHFVWAVDLFEAGQNSNWLLPNRLYEGCLNGAIPIGLRGTETAAFIERLGIGVVVPDIEPDTLIELFSGMTPERVRTLAEAVARLEPNLFRCTEAECVQLVNQLMRPSIASPALEAAE